MIFCKRKPSIWACPYCKKQLDDNLKCKACSFAGEKGTLLYLHKSDDSWRKCIIEKNGWVSMLKSIGLYKDNDDHFSMPDGREHLKQFYGDAKKHIDAFLDIENLNNKCCLDLGAGIGWVEAYILKRYKKAHLVAMDVNDDELIGLKRGEAIKKHYNCKWDSVIGDMHNIPIKENSIDIVFTVDALHHFRDINKCFEEIERVLTPGGRIYAVNEPYRPDDISENEYVKKYIFLETEHGIIERRPTISEYLDAGKSLGLKVYNDNAGIILNRDVAGLFFRGQKSENWP